MKKGLRILLAFMAIVIGLYPAIYFIIDRKFGLLQSKPESLLSDVLWNTGFYTHIILGGIALLIGWTQFTRFSSLNVRLHRNLGKVYVIACLVSAVAGVYIAFFATSGMIASAGFMSLGILWFSFTFSAYRSAIERDFEKHEKLMILSYACCFSAVTLRVWLPLLIALFGEFNIAYQIVAWLCWIPNLFAAYLIIRRTGQKKLVS